MLRFFLLLCLCVVPSTKGKRCLIPEPKNSTVVKIINNSCTTLESKPPCNTTEHVTELDVSHTKIEIIKPDMFTCLKNLKTLTFDNNVITTIQQEAFSNLTDLESLSLEGNKISSISSGVFKGLRSLTHLYLGHNSITQIEENTFFDLKLLIELKLNNNQLRKIADGAFDELQLANLQLDHNELEELPLFKKPSQITTLDMSYNTVKKIDAKTLGKHYDLYSLHMIKTDIRELGNEIFINNTKLQILSFQNCSELKDIAEKAFTGTLLQTLDLQNTPIDSLPGADLQGLRKLFIKGATELWEIPIVSFKSLILARVNYPFHCCLIKSAYDTYGEYATESSHQNTGPTIKPCVKNNATTTTRRPGTTPTTNPFEQGETKINRTKNKVITLPPDTCFDPDQPVVTTPKTPDKNLTCTPENDEFNPCGDLLGSDALRVCSWFVLVFALLGNSFKLFVLLLNKRKITIAKILMCNLAFANLCMGVFLLMIESADLYSLGQYQNFAIRWQYRTGCKIAGFVSIFSTELAVFVLTIITVERYFTIVHPLKLNKHLNTKQIIVLMGVGWGFSLAMAVLPLFKVSGYDQVAICLPFKVEKDISKAYVTFLLATNGLAFFFVLFCYGRMYCSLGGSGRGASVNRVESRVAKRMAMLVITNFACWFPIALVSLIAIYGKPLIGVPASQFFLVFVYPINSFTNPYLYAIGTKHFQIDALEILSRCGICNSAIRKATNRLRDQLETLPNSSRGVTGSKISLSSMRSPHQSPGMSPRSSSHISNRGSSFKSHNGSVKSNNNYRHSGSPRDSPSCSPCSFLTIPLIHRKNYNLNRQQESTDSRFSLSLQENNAADKACNSLKSSSDVELDKILARRASAREVVLVGQTLSNWNKAARKSSTNSLVKQELMPLESKTRNDVNKTAEEEEVETVDSPILQVPVVMVTTC